MSGPLEALERRLWLEGPQAYRELVSEDATIVVPMEGGILDREGCLAAIAAAPRWREVVIDGARTSSPAVGLTMIAYRAEARRDGPAWRALCSSLWRETPQGPRLVHHQQTPLP